jgi:hypothetical protein
MGADREFNGALMKPAKKKAHILFICRDANGRITL